MLCLVVSFLQRNGKLERRDRLHTFDGAGEESLKLDG